MTYSILARDPQTGAIGGAAATGSLCVGGWVLRGDARIGMSASQGASPSTLWGEEVLQAMALGVPAEQSVSQVIQKDSGRAFRQLAALDLEGRTGVFTGESNLSEKGAVAFTDGIASGNTLAGEIVLEELARAFHASALPFAERLIEALAAGERAGGDSRGLRSAALLVVSRKASPLTLRIDYSEDPIDALRKIYARSQDGDYAKWAAQVPTLDDPERVLD